MRHTVAPRPGPATTGSAAGRGTGPPMRIDRRVVLPEPAESEVLEIGGLHLHPGDRVGPYVYRRPLGKGGTAHVVLASDPDGRPVALKVLKSSRVGTGLLRFKREFRALARLRHPNVIRVEAYGDLFGHPYIAMEYVEGHDLHAAIHRFRTLPSEERWRRCEEILVDLCRALAYIHRRGLVHRDLKPSNVLIDPDHRCKLTDFGIVKDLDPEADSAVSTTLVGTWAYASPEQITGQPIDHRSDLYSLGVILFAMLTGRRPFVARDLGGYLELHRSHQAPAPREVDPSIPAHLDEICLRLLRKQPRERFRSAQEILYRLEQIEVDADEGGIADWVPPLVGRDAEEEALREHIASLTRQEGGLVLVEGLEGAGKTRLLEGVTAQCQLMGIPCHRERVAQRDSPLGPMLRVGTALGRELGARTPRELDAALQVFSREDGWSVGNARERLLSGLIEAIELLLEDGPLVLILDDLHNAQLPTLDALQTLVRRVCAVDHLPLLVVAAVRPDRVNARLGALRQGSGLDLVPHLVPVGALTRAAVEQLVAKLIGPGRPATVLAERLYRETDGNALFLVLFLQNLILHGMLTQTGATFRLSADVEDIASGHFDVPPGVRQVVRARLAPLSDLQRPLLDALAVSGREVDLDVLLDVLDLDEDAAAEHLEQLEDLGIVRQRRAGQQVSVDFAHSKFGDVLYRELDLERRADLHRRVAAALEVRHMSAPAAAEIVGEHYRRAGEAGKAYHYLTTAARRLAERGMPNEAGDLLARAQMVEDPARVDLGPDEFNAIKQQILLTRSDVCFVRGELGEAREALEQAETLTGPGVDGALALRIPIRLGRVLRALGELDLAEHKVLDVLDRARAAHDREAIAEGLLGLAGIAWSRGALEICETRAHEGLVLATGAALGGARARLLLALTAVQASRGQLASAASGLSEAQLLFKELRLKPERSFALANLAEVLLDQGDLGAAWQNATEALQEARDSGHRAGEAAGHAVRGVSAAFGGMRALARQELDLALGVCRALGLHSEMILPLCVLACAAIEEGRLDVALTKLDSACEAAKLADPERYAPLVRALRAQAHIARGDHAKAREEIAAAEAAIATLPVIRRTQVGLEVGRALAQLGETAAASAHLREVSHLTGMRGFRLLGVEALRLAEALSTDPDERRRLHAATRDYVHDLGASAPVAWQAAFRARLGFGA